MARWPSASSYPGTPKAYPATPKAYPSTLNAFPASSAPEVTPVTIMGANAVEWWRSDLGITIDTGVSTWHGQVAGIDFSQGTGVSQPTYNATGGPNSTPSLLFDGSNDALAGTALARALPQTVWLIGRHITWTSNDSWINDTGVTLTVLQRTASVIIAMTAGSPGNNNGGAALDQYRRVQAEFTNSVADRLLVGSTSVTGANVGSTAGVAPLLGRNSAGTTFGNVEICEVAFFNVVPSAGQLAELDTYVTDRYGAGLV